MTRKGRQDWKESQREHAEQTDTEERSSREISEDAGLARDDWGDQLAPVLTDTAEALSSLADELKAEIQEQHAEQVGLVEGAVESQRSEVSEPARVDGATEQSAAEGLDSASSRNPRFGHLLAEASNSRRDAEAFLQEIAEFDEQDQRETNETLEEHRRAVQAAIEDIEGF